MVNWDLELIESGWDWLILTRFITYEKVVKLVELPFLLENEVTTLDVPSLEFMF